MDWKFVFMSSISCVIAGMGMGGGSLFIIFGMMFFGIPQRELQGLNLIMFVSSGISATILNLKNKIIDKKIAKKILPCLMVGSIIGVYIAAKINENSLRKYFLGFITIIGLYEIITSLIDIKNTKNNNEK